jgi:hypothetical protein
MKELRKSRRLDSRGLSPDSSENTVDDALHVRAHSHLDRTVQDLRKLAE